MSKSEENLPNLPQIESAVHESLSPVNMVLEESPASPQSFSTDQLERWKDEIAEWWGAEKLRYDHKKVVSLFQQWFRIKKEEAIKMEFNSREDNEKFIEQFLDHVIAEFERKLHEKDIARLNVKLSFQSGAHATVLFKGHEYKHDVPGHAGIVGEVYYGDGTRQSVFQRFISHPFWQYSHRSSQPVASAENGKIKLSN